jgi:hypothetical protein
MGGEYSMYGEQKGVYRLLVGENLMERERLEYQGVDWRIIIRLIFRKWDVGAWTGSIWLRIGIGGWHL